MNDITVALTINDRPLLVLERVFSSLKDQGQDATVIVLDGAPKPVVTFTRDWWGKRADIVEYARPQGWLCPARAWNVAFERVDTEWIYCTSSEVIQREGNVAAARRLLAGNPCVLFGSCEDDGPDPLVVSDRPNVLCDSKMPRPLGFIWAAPFSNVADIGGFDEEFMRGYWFDDDDFFYRLWQTGLPFVFDDKVHGVHQHHDRPVLETTAGQDGIRGNATYMMNKHGHLHPLSVVPKNVYSRGGRTVWERAGESARKHR